MIITLWLLWIIGYGCGNQIKRDVDTLQDLKPFVARSPAARQKNIEDKRDISALTALLADKDQGVVMRAAAYLGESGDAMAAPPLIDMLDHQEPSLRFVVSKALVELGPAAVPALIDALKDKNPTVVSSAVEILAKIGDPRAVVPLSSLLKQHRTDDIGLAIISALGVLGGKEVAPALIEMLTFRDSQAHYAAAEALVNIGGPAVPNLIAVLDTPDTDMALVIIEILGQTGDIRAVSPIIGILQGGRSDAVRMAAVRSLGRLGNPVAIPALRDAILEDEVSVVKSLAAEALISLSPASVEVLVEILKTDDPEIQDLASDGLVKIGPPAVDVLIERLSANDPTLVWLVIDTLGNIKDEKAINPLIDRLQDDDPDIVIKAADALGNFGTASVIDPLILVMKNPQSPARHVALEALINIGAPAVPSLIEALLRDDGKTRKMASDALIKIGSPAVDLLASEMRTQDRAVRKIAGAILTAIGTDSVDALGSILVEKNDPNISTSAAAVLVKIGNKAAVQALADGLSFWPARNIAATALDAVAWNPSTPLERIQYLIGKGRKKELLADWETTRYLLSKKLQSSRSQTNEYGVNAFIALGEIQIIPQLLEFLKKNDSPPVARIYLHSGKEELIGAAENWLDQNNDTKGADANEIQWVLWGSMDGGS